MANKACLARLRKELRNFQPPPYIRAAPLEANLQEWHYVLQGPPDSPFVGGLYHGKLKFPDDFPFKPPSIYMITPNGRFETDRRLCLSISDFHPESWVPTWSVCTILNGILSFMLESSPTTGAIETSLATKHRLRDESAEFNDRDEAFRTLFPDLVGGKLFTDPSQGSTVAASADVDEASSQAADLVTTRAVEDATGETATAGVDTCSVAVGRCNASLGGDANCSNEGQGTGGNAEGGEASTPDTEAVPGKNAAKNRKKREKLAAKKKELASQAAASLTNHEAEGSR